jgi:hypothetical protein
MRKFIYRDGYQMEDNYGSQRAHKGVGMCHDKKGRHYGIKTEKKNQLFPNALNKF